MKNDRRRRMTEQVNENGGKVNGEDIGTASDLDSRLRGNDKMLGR
jgi:hypothetical protein